MPLVRIALAATFALTGSLAYADNSPIILGESTYKARCAVCHGENADGKGTASGLFAVTPPDLTQLSERAGGAFPFSDVYRIVQGGAPEAAHGESSMPIWGEYFMADALQDRGVSQSDAIDIAVGRTLSLVYYLESIQQ